MRIPHIHLPSTPSQRKSLALRIGLTLLVMFAPLIVTLIMTLPLGENPFAAIPQWNDENWWFAQYAAISKFGRPLGYFGYAGTHASVGTWGPWGMFPLLLTGLFARIFGWGLHAFVYYNFFFLAASALIFILLAKPDTRGLICLAITNALAYIAICFAIICMNEVVRYSVALVLSGIMVRLIKEPECPRVRFILRCTAVPILLAYATAFYVILGAFIPVYVFLMLRKLKPVWRVLIAAAVSAVAIYFIRRLNSITCAPYITSASSMYNRALPDSLSFKIQNLYYQILDNAHKIDPFYLLSRSSEDEEYPVLIWFCFLLYALIGMHIWRFAANAKKSENRTELQLNTVCLFLLLAFWGGHIVLYETGSWTFIRGCYTAVYCALMIGAVAPKSDAHPWRTGIIICVIGAVTFGSIYVSMFARYARFSTPAQDEQWLAQRQELEEVIDLDPDAEDPWANTVVLLGYDDETYYILPYGVGVNGDVDEVYNKNAKYVIVGYNYSEASTRDERIETLKQNGHEILYETDKYTVLINSAKFG